MNTTLTFGVLGLPNFGVAFAAEPPQKSAKRVPSTVDHKLHVTDDVSALVMTTRDLVDKTHERDLREAQDAHARARSWPSIDPNTLASSAATS